MLPFVFAMVCTGHGEANREVFLSKDRESLHLVGWVEAPQEIGRQGDQRTVIASVMGPFGDIAYPPVPSLNHQSKTRFD